MGLKDEVRQAKAAADELREAGEELDAIALRLNQTQEGFYYASGGRLYRENVPDYVPPVRLL